MLGILASANYTNIRPGDYTFELNASNSDGTWNNEPFALPIIISPPWWIQKIAYLIYVLIFLVFFCFLQTY